MMRFLVVLMGVFSLAAAPAAAAAVPVVFDTDMGNDIDDALALAVLHALETRAECRIIAVTVTKDNPWSAPYIDLVNTFYGRAHIPVGMVADSGIAPDDNAMTRVPAERKRLDGTLVYPHRIASGAEAPDSVSLLRRVLAAEQDGSVVMVQVGFSTNLARLLDSEPDASSQLPGRELVERKVKLLSIMAGNFEDGSPEYNVREDAASAQKLFAEWPSQIVASGFEIGMSLLFPATSIENDFSYVADHPVADAYRNYMEMPYDRPTWDLTSALYAIRPDPDYFSLSPPGTISANELGGTSFEPDPNGRHQYLIVNDTQRARVLEALILLASEPPSLR